jgi:hypothetical protein
MAGSMYMGDYDDRFPVPQYTDEGPKRTVYTKTWVQVLLPYVRNFEVFHCPSDHAGRAVSNAVFDGDLVVGDSYSRYYSASQRVNFGYNYLYLAPVSTYPGTGWSTQARYGSSVQNPSETLMYADSVWDLSVQGTPTGGGNFLVNAPCRYTMQGGRLRDTFGLGDNVQLMAGGDRWDMGHTTLSLRSFGGTYPWHNEKMTIGMVDGRAKPLRMEQVVAGCDVQPNWRGYIFDLSSYIWDLE